MSSNTKKINVQKLKSTPFITPYNKTRQQNEAVVFPNGIKVNLDNDLFNRGIEITPTSAPNITTNRLYNENGTLKFDGTAVGGSGGSGAPTTPKYVVMDSSPDSAIPNALTLKGGTNITLTEASGEVTIDASSSGGGADVGNGYLLYPGASTPSDLTAQRTLLVGDGLDGSDGGDGGNYTISIDVTDFIDTASGLTESTNNIQINLYSNGGLSFDGGAVKVNVGNGVSLDSSGNVVNDPTDENVALASGFYGG